MQFFFIYLQRLERAANNKLYVNLLIYSKFLCCKRRFLLILIVCIIMSKYNGIFLLHFVEFLYLPCFNYLNMPRNMSLALERIADVTTGMTVLIFFKGYIRMNVINKLLLSIFDWFIFYVDTPFKFLIRSRLYSSCWLLDILRLCSSWSFISLVVCGLKLDLLFSSNTWNSYYRINRAITVFLTFCNESMQFQAN